MKLRILTDADEAALLDLLTSDRIKQTYMLPDFDRREDAIPLARRLTQLSREDHRYLRGMEQDGILVGYLNEVEVQGDSVELGYLVHPDHWNKGFATAALKLAIEDQFRRGFREVICGAFESNPTSLRVMKKAGMALLERVDEIEYRGKTHRCLYRSIQAADRR